MIQQNITMEMKILDSRIGTEFPLPEYAKSGDAGIDLRAMFTDEQAPNGEYVLGPNQTVMVSSGISIHIKDESIVGVIVPRSGMGHKNGIVISNLTGIIDSGYQGTYGLSLWNRGNSSFTIKTGERVAQLLFVPVFHPEFVIVDEFGESSDRGEGGFGSSGTN